MTRFDNAFAPWLVTAADDFHDRHALQYVSLVRVGRQSYLDATNGRALCRVPADCVGREEEPGLIRGEVLQVAAKASLDNPASAFAAFTRHGKRSEVTGAPGAPSFENPAGTFPDVTGVIPDAGARTAFAVVLDPTLLLLLAQSIGSEASVRLSFSAPGESIRVEPGLVNGAVGVLMPRTS